MDTRQSLPTNSSQRLQPPISPQPPAKQSALLPWLIRLPLLGATAIILLVFLAILFVAVHQFQYDGLIYPGVSSFGVKLSGMTSQQAAAALASRYTYGEDAVFTFRDGQKAWQMTARDLGVSFDPAKTVAEAYKVGRGADLVSNLISESDTWLNGHAIQPVVVYDQSRASSFLEKISTEINKPVQDATIVLTGTKVVTSPSQVGRTLDIPATLGLLRPVVLNMNTGAEINLLIRETQPAILDSEAVAQQIRTAVASPIQIYIETSTTKDPGPWQVSPDFIAGMLSVVRVEDANGAAHYALNTTLDPLKNFMITLAPQLAVEPVNARFLFNDTTRQLDVITESVDGRKLDTDTTMKHIQATLFKKEDRRVALVFQKDIPTVNSAATGQQLGITEQVVQATTFFYGSTAERRTNIQVAAARFHGLVIAPGEEFSFNKYLGDVSPETGFETGLVIFGNQTIKGVGGGVCQVSSTVFQAAFFTGFPIKERYAHGYRVGYYESGSAIANGQKYNSGVGLDATVYGPIVDLKFVNDTPYYLLMESIYRANEQSLTFKFYSTSTGRVVTKEGPTLSNNVAHTPPRYQESGDLKPGQTRQVDFAVDGVDTHVYRTITQNGQVIVNREDFYSHYLPWSDIFQVAVGAAPRS
ncbi:MAG: VanW family protein [Chloroflexota bacterium]